MHTHRTQVGIVGAGPAGLMLGHLLHREGIDSMIVEDRSQEHVVERVRAGVLEQGTVNLMRDAAVGARLEREGMRHGGIYIAFGGMRHRIDMARLTGGRAITIYGQNEVVKDLIGARTASGRPLLFEVSDVAVHDLEGRRPRISFTSEGAEHEIACDFVAGCDGFHGICRPSIPSSELRAYEREYPFAWLGILADAAPSSDELVYSMHGRGFALFSMRSPAVTRLYLQCRPEEDIADWPDDRIWAELRTRLATSDGWQPAEGPITSKSITPMRSFVVEPMRYGRLFLAGDAHRAANRRQRTQSRNGGCLASRRRARRVLPCGPRDGTGRVLRQGPAPSMARAAVLVVDDVDAPPPGRDNPVRRASPNRRPRISHQLDGRDDEPRRAVRRDAVRLVDRTG
jgi:p-hydroxybenzoate 3-monooxygenase